AQSVAAMIEMNLLGIEPGSENTEMILNLVKVTPLLIVVTSVIGPILEEIIFRKIIFGSLYRKYNFFISAFISSLIF
ncbi:CPBP family intramembrane metalloprotease, partial [Escherichia coli]|nr:CPBP family intramembrane metalloprotease [Escherichia coli]